MDLVRYGLVYAIVPGMHLINQTLILPGTQSIAEQRKTTRIYDIKGAYSALPNIYRARFW